MTRVGSSLTPPSRQLTSFISSFFGSLENICCSAGKFVLCISYHIEVVLGELPKSSRCTSQRKKSAGTPVKVKRRPGDVEDRSSARVGSCLV